jgi:hypothetical protein
MINIFNKNKAINLLVDRNQICPFVNKVMKIIFKYFHVKLNNKATPLK